MNRTDRLRRYEGKDYTQRVKFPVEIVGPDNQVRRYPFEAAVLLYQRRVGSAVARYGDPATVAAEVQHCRLRIAQLRKSFLHAGGIGTPSGDGILASPLAAEVLSFLQRVFGETGAEGAMAALSSLGGAGGETWWLPAPSGGGWLLYAFRLDGEGPQGARVELDRALQRLGAAREEPGAERLLVGRVGEDIALLLAGTGLWEGPRGLLGGEQEPDDAGEPPDAWQRALGALRHGQLASSLRQFEAALELEPHRPQLARATAVVGLLSNEPQRAEFAARHGLLAQSKEPHLAYLLALALYRQGRVMEAREVVAGSEGHVQLLAAIDAVAQGRAVRAWWLARAVRAQPAAEWFVRPVVSGCRFLAGALVVARTCAIFALGLGAMMAQAGGTWGLAAALVGVLALAFGEVRTRRLSAAALREGRFGRILLCPPELLPSETQAAAH